ncbi:MAG: hypothetical protein GEV03_02375 [Streptosporangiales bacterium]|nr:hypothetical protein [Streptosporangiales bacterium]
MGTSVAAVGLLVGSASPGLADESAEPYAIHYAYQGDDYAKYDTATNRLSACDMEWDGNSVYADWRTLTDQGIVRDNNGSADGCGVTYVGINWAFKVCEDDWGEDTCSTWIYP